MVAIVVIAVLSGGLSIAAALRVPKVQQCVLFCPPPQQHEIPGTTTFTGGSFNFTFDYPSDWTTVSSDNSSISFSTQHGTFTVKSIAGAGDVGQLIDSDIAQLPSSTYANVQPAGDLHGAEIGFSPGQGKFVDADFQPPAGQTEPVRVAVVAVAHGSTTVLVEAVSSTSTEQDFQPLGVVDGEAFDYALLHWHWKDG